MKKFNEILKPLFIIFLLLLLVKNIVFLIQPIFFGIENTTVMVMYLIEILPLIFLYILLPITIIYTVILNKKGAKTLTTIFIAISVMHFAYTKIDINTKKEPCVQLVKSGPSSQNQDTSTKKYINVTLKNICETKESISKLKAVPYIINGDKKPLVGSIVIDKVISIDSKQESSFDIDFTLNTNNENQRIYYLIEIVE